MKSANTGKPSRTNLAKLKKRSDSEIDVTGTPYNAHSAQHVNRFWENATVMPPRLRGQRGPQRTPTMRAVAQDDSAPCRLLLQRSAGLQSHYLERGAP